MNVVPTYEVKVYVGLREGHDGLTHTVEEAAAICHAYVNSVGLCVTISETHFYYKNGHEPGIVVGLINYPRFPATNKELLNHAIAIATRLKEAFGQFRVSVVASDVTVMIGEQ